MAGASGFIVGMLGVSAQYSEWTIRWLRIKGNTVKNLGVRTKLKGDRFQCDALCKIVLPTNSALEMKFHQRCTIECQLFMHVLRHYLTPAR